MMTPRQASQLLLVLLCWISYYPVCLLGLASIQPSSLQNSVLKVQKPIPITVISGFLGSGKTTLLQHLLHNKQGLRIAIVVNDVASVNIDSKLISNSPSSAASGIVELQNGCACCSKSEELLASVAELVTLSDLRGDDDAFEHIVVEMSGVADPASVRSKFQQAVLYDMPLMERVQLDTLVTVVDCSTFESYLKSPKLTSPEETPELHYRDEAERLRIQKEENDALFNEDIPVGLREILGNQRSQSSNEPAGSVAELLVSQTEVVDLVLLNKVDAMLSPGQENDETSIDQALARIEAIVRAINPRATVVPTKFANIPLQQVLALAKGQGVVQAGIVDDHKDLVQAAVSRKSTPSPAIHSITSGKTSPDSQPGAHSHSHENCEDPKCSDASHFHVHDHGNHDDKKSKEHSHSHSHSHETCVDPDCNDPSHSHSHDHGPTHAGIGTFVYTARRPFHPNRLANFLSYLPIARGLPEDSANNATVTVDRETATVLRQVIRSKGFTWCANSHVAALYWSQAGSNFDLGVIGSWWATLDRTLWPPEVVDSILQDFDDTNHDEHDGSSLSVGDRRQEIVFIGPTLDSPVKRDRIRAALDQCLLRDAEWDSYRYRSRDRDALQDLFPSPFSTRILSL